MFNKTYEDRLRAWNEFRNSLEKSDNPIQQAIDQYQLAPRVSIHTDPWTQEMWPSPWELVEENQYCEFCKLLGICYSLQLTDRFSHSNFEIHIGIDTQDSNTYYLLFVDNFVIGYADEYILKSELPSSIRSQKQYPMPKLN